MPAERRARAWSDGGWRHLLGGLGGFAHHAVHAERVVARPPPKPTRRDACASSIGLGEDLDAPTWRPTDVLFAGGFE
jgi:hypothetical protein